MLSMLFTTFTNAPSHTPPILSKPNFSHTHPYRTLIRPFSYPLTRTFSHTLLLLLITQVSCHCHPIQKAAFVSNEKMGFAHFP